MSAMVEALKLSEGMAEELFHYKSQGEFAPVVRTIEAIRAALKAWGSDASLLSHSSESAKHPPR